MSILEQLGDPAAWAAYAGYKESSLHTPARELKALRRYIENREYQPVAAAILAGGPLPPPTKTLISKMASSKKRTVYIYPRRVTMVLKLMTYLLLRKYDHIFAPNLYSFRASRGVKQAVEFLTGRFGMAAMYSYKVDVSDYFNSIDVARLLPMLEEVLADDPALCEFFRRQLTDKRVVWNGQVVEEPHKGIMAGCPTASFLANVYLSGLDHRFHEKRVPYARYSDDIIVFAPTEEEREAHAALILEELAVRGLTVNEKKEFRASPEEGWEFLGFSYRQGHVDISKASAQKLKGKMRRKADALLRWKRKKGVDNTMAVRAFIKAFNRKLYEEPGRGEITWSRWFFPAINSTDTLRELDRYMQDCLRYIATEKRTKKRFDFRYEDMKALGCRSLVHEYYKIKAESKKSAASE